MLLYWRPLSFACSLYPLHLNILGVKLSLHANREAALESLRHVFEAHTAGRASGDAHRIGLRDEEGKTRITFEGRSGVFDAESAWPRIDDFLVLLVLRERPNLQFFHGSCVANREKKAALFLGGTMSGKTTLAVALQAEGYTVLSDDVIPVDLSQATVYPFRTAMRLRKHTQSTARARSWPEGYVASRNGAQAPRELPHPIRWIFCLHPADGTAVEHGLVSERLAVWSRMRSLCWGQHCSPLSPKATVLSVRDERAFQRRPKLSACTPGPALRFALNHMRQPTPALRTLLPAMAGVFRNAELYSLVPGDLKETVSLVSSTME